MAERCRWMEQCKCLRLERFHWKLGIFEWVALIHVETKFPRYCQSLKSGRKWLRSNICQQTSPLPVWADLNLYFPPHAVQWTSIEFFFRISDEREQTQNCRAWVSNWKPLRLVVYLLHLCEVKPAPKLHNLNVNTPFHMHRNRKKSFTRLFADS